MATKSKNYKGKTALKAIAFILMIALVFTSSSLILKAAVRSEGYSQDIFNVIEGDLTHGDNSRMKLFWRSAVTHERTGTDATYLYLYAKYFRDEAAVKDGTAIKPLEEEIWNIYVRDAKGEYESQWGEANQKARNRICGLSHTDSKSEYYEKYNDYNNIPEEVLHDYITKYEPDWIPDKEKIKKDYENKYNARVIELRHNFNSLYHETIQKVEKIYDLNYVIVMPDGSRLTNFEDGNTLSPEQLREKVMYSSFGYAFSKNNVTESAGSYENNYSPLINKHARRDGFKYTKILNSLSINPDYIVGDSEFCDDLFLNSGMEFYFYAGENFSGNVVPESDYTPLYLEFLNAMDNMWLGFILLAIAIIILIVLLSVSGTRDENGEICKNPLDKIWNDYHLILSGGLAAALIIGAGVILLDDLYYQSQSNGYLLMGSNNLLELFICILATAGFALFAELLMSIVRQSKANNYLKHTSIAAIARKIKNRPKKRRIRNKIKAIREKLRKKPYKLHELRKDIWIFLGLYLLINAVLFIMAVFFIADGDEWIALFICFVMALFNIAVGIFLWKSIKALDEIMHAVDEAEQGNLNVKLNINLMPRWIRKFAQDVQDVQNGMRAAVREAVKGERMKTELITNVSHDLKTPLTSIVTYVDLLKKRPINDPEALEYIGVLDEKSARLKHLIEDLVEASKTTTGNVELHPVNLNLNELAVQSVGENEDALTAQGLEIRLNHQPESPIIVYADNQKTWRIIENLISNVRKYALEGTRVYISVERDGAFGVFSIKNITREALDVTPEELTQRFVRGDASRSTEGSGLGLSIAANLCSLQGGKLDITIDGDLFKVTVYLPLAK